MQPDLLVIRTANLDAIKTDGIEGVPALLVEILSPGNMDPDTATKRHAYARAGVPEYWIVRPDERDILVLSAPDPALGDYTSSVRVEPEAELVSPTLPIRVAAVRLFADAPTAAGKRARRRGGRRAGDGNGQQA